MGWTARGPGHRDGAGCGGPNFLGDEAEAGRGAAQYVIQVVLVQRGGGETPRHRAHVLQRDERAKRVSAPDTQADSRAAVHGEAAQAPHSCTGPGSASMRWRRNRLLGCRSSSCGFSRPPARRRDADVDLVGQHAQLDGGGATDFAVADPVADSRVPELRKQPCIAASSEREASETWWRTGR